MGAGERISRRAVVRAGETMVELADTLTAQVTGLENVAQAQAKAHAQLREEFDDLEDAVVTKDDFEKLEYSVEELQQDLNKVLGEDEVEDLIDPLKWGLDANHRRVRALMEAGFVDRLRWVLFGTWPPVPPLQTEG